MTSMSSYERDAVMQSLPVRARIGSEAPLQGVKLPKEELYVRVKREQREQREQQQKQLRCAQEVGTVARVGSELSEEEPRRRYIESMRRWAVDHDADSGGESRYGS